MTAYAWLVTLVLFWKPVYYLYMHFVKKDKSAMLHFRDWFISLWKLIKPGE